MIKNDREYRNFALMESEDKYKVRGYASTFDPYVLMNIDGEDYSERIDPHAFDDADMTDVVFLLDHTGRVYARTKNGTVTLEVDGWASDEHGFIKDRSCEIRR